MDEIIEFAGYITGEIVLYLATFGRRKLSWNYACPGGEGELFTQFSTWLGWISWGAVFLLVAWLISS